MNITPTITLRQEQLLLDLVRRYIAAAEPVSSQHLADRPQMHYSSATVRNDLAALEEVGYVYQPHTSAGRVPTEAGYQFYVQQLPKEAPLPRGIQQQLDKSRGSAKGSDQLRALARAGAEATGAAAFVAFAPYDYYYTGLSAVFSQPEFMETRLVCSLADVLDHLGLALQGMWAEVNGLDVRIGSTCPFGESFAAVVGRTSGGALFGILGPQRLDYQVSRGVVSYVIHT
jgi:transcriptional regulator of heat shock response